MSLRLSYTLIAPIYDRMVERATAAARVASLAQLGEVSGQRILLSGIGSGLDIPYLPPDAEYFGIDLTRAMLLRARGRSTRVLLTQGDVLRLPYADACCDAVVMHLILAVVPDSARALAEASRVLKSGGRIVIYDKFLRRGERAWLRRLISPLLGRIATRMDVVFEDVLATCPELRVVSDRPSLADGWFRSIVLEKI